MGNYFDSFSVLFGKQELFLNGRSYPLGQFATDFLNLDERELSAIDRSIGAFLSTVLSLIQEKTRQRRSLLSGEAERCLGSDFSVAVLSGAFYGFGICLSAFNRHERRP